MLRPSKGCHLCSDFPTYTIHRLFSTSDLPGLVDVCLKGDPRRQSTADRERLRTENPIPPLVFSAPLCVPPRTKEQFSAPPRGSIDFIHHRNQAGNIPNRPAGVPFLLTVLPKMSTAPNTWPYCTVLIGLLRGTAGGNSDASSLSCSRRISLASSTKRS